MPVHILAGAAVLGLTAVAPVAIEWAGARIEAGRQARADYAAILARIEEPRMTAEEMDAALAALRAEAAAQLQASDRRLPQWPVRQCSISMSPLCRAGVLHARGS